MGDTHLEALEEVGHVAEEGHAFAVALSTLGDERHVGLVTAVHQILPLLQP